MTESVLFYLFSLAAAVCGILVVTRRNPISSALSLVACFFFLAADYVVLDAHFVAMIQVLVYAGAIMVLFIFVIMLLNLREDTHEPTNELEPRKVLGVGIAGLVFLAILATGDHVAHGMGAEVGPSFGTISAVGTALFSPDSPYLLPFETISLLLTVGMVGAVVLAKKDI